jgi:Tol biopolymer transport system component
VPPGLIVFDRFDTAFGAEGPYLGSAMILGDGSDEKRLVGPIDSDGLGAAWSPDGDRFVVNTWTPPGLPRPGVLTADGSEFTPLDFEAPDSAVACGDWSRDGETLLCERGSDTNQEVDGIYTLRIDDARLERLTESPYHYTEGSAGGCGGGDGRARYSPDGTQIAFIRQRCGTGSNPAADESAAIELMASEGGDLRELVEQGRVKSHPGSQISWSPDGTRIAFGSQEGELFLVDVESGRVSAIPMPEEIGSHHADGPEWSPDGTRLVFSMFVESRGDTDLYAISPDGSDLLRITSGGGAEHYARWGLPDTP